LRAADAGPYVAAVITVRRSVVRLLNAACTWVDLVAYRPAVVRATRRLPRWWNCPLGKASERLDHRWRTGFWDGADAPAYPGAPCEACGRRASIVVLDMPGGPPVELCGRCVRCVPDQPITLANRRALLAEAAAQSTGRAVRGPGPRR